MIEKLPDKGESIKQFHKLVENEIKFKENVDTLECSLNQLSVLDDTEQHIKKLCEFDKSPVKERYKPFATLNKTIEIQPERKVFKVVEDCKLETKPTKLIPLMESMDIMKKQEDRIKVLIKLSESQFSLYLYHLFCRMNKLNLGMKD